MSKCRSLAVLAVLVLVAAKSENGCKIPDIPVDPTTTTTTTSTTTTTIPPSPVAGVPDADGFNWNEIRWVTDLPAPNAVKDTNAVLVSAWTDGKKCYVTWGPKYVWTPNDGFCDGFFSTFYDDGVTNKHMGGRFEWCPINRYASIPWGAALDPASGHRFPQVAGSDLYLAIYGLKGAKRTNVVRVKWAPGSAAEAVLTNEVPMKLNRKL